VRRGRHHADVDEILDRVPGQVLEQALVRNQRDRVEDDGVAVGRRARSGLHAEVAGGAAAVLDDDARAELIAERASNDQAALHGLARALANNAIQGVTEGFSRQMDVVGVGYKADVQGRKVVFALGYSHPIEYPLPEGIEAKAERMTTKGSIQQYQTTLTVSGIDKQKLGQVCAEMHKLRKPDAYKGKGVRYADVPLKLKPGKTGK
jgi:large subunit ribosomal protein L6